MNDKQRVFKATVRRAIKKLKADGWTIARGGFLALIKVPIREPDGPTTGLVKRPYCCPLMATCLVDLSEEERRKLFKTSRSKLASMIDRKLKLTEGQRKWFAMAFDVTDNPERVDDLEEPRHPSSKFYVSFARSLARELNTPQFIPDIGPS